MKILFVVTTNNELEFVKDYVKYICLQLIKDGNEVIVYDHKNCYAFNYSTKELLYGTNNVTKKTPLFIKVLNRITHFNFFLKKFGSEIKVAHFFSIRQEYLLNVKNIVKYLKIYIINIYGSDILQNKVIAKLHKKLVLNSYRIIITNEKLKEHLYSLYNLTKNIETIYLPLFALDAIIEKRKQVTKELAKEKFGLSKNDYLIAVGISYFKSDKYIEIINELKKIKNDNIKFLFQLTYGSSESYKEELLKLIREQLDKKKCIIIDEYLELEDVAYLRLATDLYLNIRHSDQFTAMIPESLLAECDLISADWLLYKELDDIGIEYFKIKTEKELLSLIATLQNQQNTLRLKTNSEKIYKHFNNKIIVSKYLSIYYEISKK